ncbi:MAG: FprA family A-type flavoprotein [Candidatus Margulisiibacteriota bacterium]|nr:FprA family A-type flavoprotein [Candidatus Margulisiibacteriota bacterium]
MSAKELKKNIYYVGASHRERKTFDELIPLPDGTSYNSYLIKGSEKTALLDTVDPAKNKELVNSLRSLKVDRIDYIISHHCEQDHSGAIPTLLTLYKMAKVVTNPKCKELLKEHLLIPEEKFITVNDRETLSLGDKTLEFIYTPWVHWPETMCTYLKEDNILFSCDFFGSHMAINDLFVKDKEHVYTAAKRYYAEIMMPFRPNIRKNLEKLHDLKIKTIAPSHGPIYDDPSLIVDAYKDWVSDKVKNEVVIPYVSMHGSTAKMVDHLVESLEKAGAKVKPFNLGDMDLGELAMALVDAATVVIGSPTVLVGPHPLAVYAAYLTNALRPKTRFVSVVGSYGWGGKMVDNLKRLIPTMKVELIEPVVIKGFPKEKDFKALENLANTIKEKHQEVI